MGPLTDFCSAVLYTSAADLRRLVGLQRETAHACAEMACVFRRMGLRREATEADAVAQGHRQLADWVQNLDTRFLDGDGSGPEPQGLMHFAGGVAAAGS